MITIEEIQRKLKEAEVAMILLSKEVERLEMKYSDLLCAHHPFSVSLLEVVQGMVEWQHIIKNYLEVTNLGRYAAN